MQFLNGVFAGGVGAVRAGGLPRADGRHARADHQPKGQGGAGEAGLDPGEQGKRGKKRIFDVHLLSDRLASGLDPVMNF